MATEGKEYHKINSILACQPETTPLLFFWANNDNKRNKNEIVSAFILFVLPTFCLVLQRLKVMGRGFENDGRDEILDGYAWEANNPNIFCASVKGI